MNFLRHLFSTLTLALLVSVSIVAQDSQSKPSEQKKVNTFIAVGGQATTSRNFSQRNEYGAFALGSYELTLPGPNAVVEGRYTIRRATKTVDGNILQNVANVEAYVPVYLGETDWYIAPEVGIARSHVWAYEDHSQWSKTTDYVPVGLRVGFKKYYSASALYLNVLNDDSGNRPRAFTSWFRATMPISEGNSWRYFAEGSYSRTSFFAPNYGRRFTGDAVQVSLGIAKSLAK